MTNIELVEIAKLIYAEKKTCYAKGGIGWTLTQARYNYLRNQYEANKTYLNESDLGKCACDCSGMVVGMAYDGWRVNQEPTWTRAHDWNDQMLHDRLTECVSPDKAEPGMCLWKQGHVGLYIGDGMALDSNIDKDGDGVHLRKVSDVKWTLAGKLPEIEYIPVKEDIKVGDVVEMEVYSIADGYAYGKVWVGIDKIVVGSMVTINPGAVAGGLNSKYRGLLIDPKYANGKYVDTVTKIETHYGNQEALLKNLVTWVDLKYLNLA